MDEMYLQEAVYDTSPTLKKIETLFGKMHEDVLKFYDGMKKHNLNTNSASDIVNYYYSTTPDSDGTRFTQYNENLKEIEDLVKKMFKVRSVRINFQLISYYGPNTSMTDKAIFTVPMMRNGSRSIVDLMDAGTLTKTSDGKYLYRVGYKTEVKASKKGIEVTNDGINLEINMEMIDKLTPKHYVAILLHEIGHNFDTVWMNIDVKNDAKFIKVLSTYGKSSTLNPVPKMSVLFTLLKERNAKKKKHYTDAMIKQMQKIGGSLGYGGDNKRKEQFADQLPTAYGYGPALIEGLQIMSPDLQKSDRLDETKGLFSAYNNYKKALQIAAHLNDRDASGHGSNVYRLKIIMSQLKKDLEETKDSKLKDRLKENIKELEKILDGIVNNKENTPEMVALIKAWVDNMDVIGMTDDNTVDDEKKEVQKNESAAYENDSVDEMSEGLVKKSTAALQFAGATAGTAAVAALGIAAVKKLKDKKNKKKKELNNSDSILADDWNNHEVDDSIIDMMAESDSSNMVKKSNLALEIGLDVGKAFFSTAMARVASNAYAYTMQRSKLKKLLNKSSAKSTNFNEGSCIVFKSKYSFKAIKDNPDDGKVTIGNRKLHVYIFRGKDTINGVCCVATRSAGMDTPLLFLSKNFFDLPPSESDEILRQELETLDDNLLKKKSWRKRDKDTIDMLKESGIEEDDDLDLLVEEVIEEVWGDDD